MKKLPVWLWVCFGVLGWMMPVAGDGLIVIHPPIGRPVPPDWIPPVVPRGHFSFAPMEVVYHRVTVDIRDRVATTSVDQEFYNPNNQRMEGTYLFPLPDGAHIDKFEMDIDGTMMEAELLSADKARKIYEDIVRQMKDPALMEYAGRGAFKVRIYPIEPKSKKRVKITYTQLLNQDGGLMEYVYPLNTEKFSAAPIKDVSVKVTLDGTLPLKSVVCPSHPVDIRRDGERRAVVGFEGRDLRPDTDFKLIFSRTENPLGIDLVCSRVDEGGGTFMLLASPGITAPAVKAQPKDLVLVLDTSGSMAGDKLNQAKKALLFCLENLNADDRFDIVRFSTEAEPLFNGLREANGETLIRAREFVEGLKPIGGTAIGDALGAALKLRPGEVQRPFHVLFLTDGLPTIGETRQDPLVDQVAKANAALTRIFTFGIGSDVNTHLLDRIATETRAVSTYVLPGEDLEIKLSAFYGKIAEPALSEISLSFTNPDIRVTHLHPHRLPDLFKGEMLTVFGRYQGHGPSAVRIRGIINGKPHEFVADLKFAESEAGNAYVPVLWATRRVGWLLDEIRLRGESAELKDEVTQLAREYGIVTPYTAYLILEDERRRDVPVAQRNLRELEADRPAADAVARKMLSLDAEARDVRNRSGDEAVFNAMDMQELSVASAPVQSAGSSFGGRAYNTIPKSAPMPLPGGEKLGYRAEISQTYARQSKLVRGRSFFQNGAVWNDSTAQARKNLPEVRVAFGSGDYFDLLKKHPEATAWFALGANLDVVLDGTLYQIRES